MTTNAPNGRAPRPLDPNNPRDAGFIINCARTGRLSKTEIAEIFNAALPNIGFGNVGVHSDKPINVAKYVPSQATQVLAVLEKENLLTGVQKYKLKWERDKVLAQLSRQLSFVPSRIDEWIDIRPPKPPVPAEEAAPEEGVLAEDISADGVSTDEVVASDSEIAAHEPAQPLIGTAAPTADFSEPATSPVAFEDR